MSRPFAAVLILLIATKPALAMNVDWLFQFPDESDELEQRIETAHLDTENTETLSMELMSIAVDVRRFVSESHQQVRPSRG